MAAVRFNDPIEPMDLANMRENGVRSLDIMCHQCRHEVIMNVDHLPGDPTVPSFGPRMVCAKCGIVGAWAPLAHVKPRYCALGCDSRSGKSCSIRRAIWCSRLFASS